MATFRRQLPAQKGDDRVFYSARKIEQHGMIGKVGQLCHVQGGNGREILGPPQGRPSGMGAHLHAALVLPDGLGGKLYVESPLPDAVVRVGKFAPVCAMEIHDCPG